MVSRSAFVVAGALAFLAVSAGRGVGDVEVVASEELSISTPQVGDPTSNDLGVPTTTQQLRSTNGTAVVTSESRQMVPSETLLEEIAAARERWSATGIDSYKITWSPWCNCPPVTYVTTVLDGIVTSHASTDDQFNGTTQGVTMEILFGQIEQAVVRAPSHLDAEFSPESGAVQSYLVDYDHTRLGDEIGVSVARFEIIESLPEPNPDVERPLGDVFLQALDVDHPCAYGFAKGSTGQELGLIIRYLGQWIDGGPVLTEPIQIGQDAAWSATLLIGTDLFANWCTDVELDGGVASVVEREYVVVAGTLIGTVEGSTATAMLRGLVAEPVSDGETIRIGQISLVNERWGFLPG